MKKILTITALLFTIGSFAQVKVTEKNVSIDGSKNGFYIELPYGDQKSIEKSLKDELKSWKGKFSESKGIMKVDDGKRKDMGENTFDTYGKVEEKTDGGANVSISIDLGGAYLNSSEHSSQFKIMESVLQKWGVKAAKTFVDGEIKTEEKRLKERQKSLAEQEKLQEKLEKEIEDYKKKITEDEKLIEESKKNQE